MQNNSGISFMQGLVFGVVVGATAGILLAPKSGADTRADIAAAAKRYQEKAQGIYSDARASIERKIAALKEAGKNIDKARYQKLVDETVSEMQDTKNLTQEQGAALGSQLKADSSEILSALKA